MRLIVASLRATTYCITAAAAATKVSILTTFLASRGGKEALSFNWNFHEATIKRGVNFSAYKNAVTQHLTPTAREGESMQMEPQLQLQLQLQLQHELSLIGRHFSP